MEAGGESKIDNSRQLSTDVLFISAFWQVKSNIYDLIQVWMFWFCFLFFLPAGKYITGSAEAAAVCSLFTSCTQTDNNAFLKLWQNMDNSNNTNHHLKPNDTDLSTEAMDQSEYHHLHLIISLFSCYSFFLFCFFGLRQTNFISGVMLYISI